MKIIVSRAARNSLDEIWLWNATQYGRDHAQAYIGFIEFETAKLSTAFSRGRLVSADPGVRYVVIKHRSRGHGHIVVYEVFEAEIHVINYFHTAQDWQSRLSDE